MRQWKTARNFHEEKVEERIEDESRIGSTKGQSRNGVEDILRARENPEEEWLDEA